MSASKVVPCIARSPSAAATPTYYNNQATFNAAIGTSKTDDDSNPGYVFIQNNAQMSAVFNETDYETTGFQNLNIVNGGFYCAGCNGSFKLIFTTTSVGTPAGVEAVGPTIPVHNMGVPYFAYITFGDNTTANIALPAAGSFWGVSAPERITSIHMGLSGGGATTSGSFGIDNLTIAQSKAVCGNGNAARMDGNGRRRGSVTDYVS